MLMSRRHFRRLPVSGGAGLVGMYGNDLRIVVFTAAPGTPGADRLAVLNVVGAQDFSRTSNE